MRILAFNGSPRGNQGNTERILQPFLDGAREAGAETETIYLRDLEIKPCLGCYTCWTKTPGVCVHKDDMPPLLVQMRQADILVYATPLYIFTVTGIMIEGMPRVYSPARAGDLQAVFQFHVTGDEPGDYHLRIADGACTFHEEIAQDASVTITTPAEVWLAIARGEIQGGQAMMQGLYSVSGNFSLMMQMEGLFSGADAGVAPVAGPGGPFKIPGMTWLAIAFVPWIAHWVLAGFGQDLLWSIGLPFLLSAGLWLYRRAYIGTTWLDSGSPIYFAAAGLLSLLAPNFWATYGSVLGILAMAGIWMGTLATGAPLTAEYSRWNYPPELARDPLFVKTNAILTAFWVTVFMLQVVLALVGAANPAREMLWLIVRYGTLIPAFWFTSWFQRWYPAHVAASGARGASRQKALMA